MKQKYESTLKWVMMGLVFLGLLLLLFSAVALFTPWHEKLLVASLVLFGLVIVAFVVIRVTDRILQQSLTDDEKKALKYLFTSCRDGLKAENFILIHGADVYHNLLRKGLVEYFFLLGHQEVYCRLSEKGYTISEKL